MCGDMVARGLGLAFEKKVGLDEEETHALWRGDRDGGISHLGVSANHIGYPEKPALAIFLPRCALRL